MEANKTKGVLYFNCNITINTALNNSVNTTYGLSTHFVARLSLTTTETSKEA